MIFLTWRNFKCDFELEFKMCVCVCDRERVKVQQEVTAKLSKGANHNHVREQRGSHVRQLAHWTLPLRRVRLKSLHRVDRSTEKQPWLVSSRQLSTSDATTELVLGRTLVPHRYLIQYRKWRGEKRHWKTNTAGWLLRRRQKKHLWKPAK